jgi:hypothetical protein
MPVTISEEFAAWVRSVLDSHHVKSLRQAEIRTRISYSTVGHMLNGRVPESGTFIRFASAYGEDVPAALRIAGFRDIATVWETGAAPVPEETREREPDADLPDGPISWATGLPPENPDRKLAESAWEMIQRLRKKYEEEERRGEIDEDE